MGELGGDSGGVGTWLIFGALRLMAVGLGKQGTEIEKARMGLELAASSRSLGYPGAGGGEERGCFPLLVGNSLVAEDVRRRAGLSSEVGNEVIEALREREGVVALVFSFCDELAAVEAEPLPLRIGKGGVKVNSFFFVLDIVCELLTGVDGSVLPFGVEKYFEGGVLEMLSTCEEPLLTLGEGEIFDDVVVVVWLGSFSDLRGG